MPTVKPSSAAARPAWQRRPSRTVSRATPAGLLRPVSEILAAKSEPGAAALPVTLDAHAVVDARVAQGAILDEGGAPLLLVGALEWQNAGLIYIFPAFGDRASDARAFSFTAVHVKEGEIHFERAGGGELRLMSIDAAPVEDPDDYRIAWDLWQQVAPLRAPLIRQAFDSLG